MSERIRAMGPLYDAVIEHDDVMRLLRKRGLRRQVLQLTGSVQSHVESPQCYG
jgi:hypothetical protein